MDGDRIGIVGSFLPMDTHADRAIMDARAAKVGVEIGQVGELDAATALEEDRQMDGTGPRGGKDSVKALPKVLQTAMESALSSIFLVSKHAGPERRAEAQQVLDRYKHISYYNGWDRRPPSPLADWNRVGAHVLENFRLVENAYETVRGNVERLNAWSISVAEKVRGRCCSDRPRA